MTILIYIFKGRKKLNVGIIYLHFLRKFLSSVIKFKKIKGIIKRKMEKNKNISAEKIRDNKNKNKDSTQEDFIIQDIFYNKMDWKTFKKFVNSCC